MDISTSVRSPMKTTEKKVKNYHNKYLESVALMHSFINKVILKLVFIEKTYYILYTYTTNKTKDCQQIYLKFYYIKYISDSRFKVFLFFFLFSYFVNTNTNITLEFTFFIL